MAGAAQGDPKPGRQLPRARWITGSKEIRALMQRGKRSRTAHLDVFAAPSPASLPRVGLIVPRHRQTAVRRNRLKRQLRELIRLELVPQLGCRGAQIDVLVRARREAYQAAFGVLRNELVTWMSRT
jgi:ribonuclease P protein component